MSERPPFENRWTSGKTAWRWHQQLEALGVETVRLRLAMAEAASPIPFPCPDIPSGFVRDWLRHHDHRPGREPTPGGLVAALLIGGALIAIAIIAWVLHPA
jgi:hypothetical protein